MQDSNLAMTGAEDGTLRVVNLSTGRIIGQLAGHGEGESEHWRTMFVQSLIGSSGTRAKMERRF